MTIEEFEKTAFSVNTKVKYKDGNIYNVVSVDFDENLIGIEMFPHNEEINNAIRWVRCENCEILKL